METPVQIIKKSSDKVGQLNAAEFIDFWPKRSSVELQKCSARVISKEVSSLSETTDVTSLPPSSLGLPNSCSADSKLSWTI